MTMYGLTITGGAEGQKDNMITDVQVGSLALINFAAKEAAPVLEENAEYRVDLIELPELAGNPPKTLIGMTADGESVNGVIKVRLSKLRKQAKESNTAAPSQGDPWHPAGAETI